jgi:predicted permease
MEYAWAILPYWWRFWQCIRRWYDDRSNKTNFGTLSSSFGESWQVSQQ